MRFLLQSDESDHASTNVGRLVGIALGVAGGVIIITGAVWFLYRRFGGRDGWINGIPPERKMLVFTDVGKLPDSAQRTHLRPGSARAASATAAANAKLNTTPRPLPQSVRPGSAGNKPGPRLPALTLGADVESRPTTPGSIGSPRGHGRAYSNTLDQPRISNTGAGPSAPAGGGDGSRPSSAAGRPVLLLPPGHGASGGMLASAQTSGERLGTEAGGTRPSSAGLAVAAGATLPAGVLLSSSGTVGPEAAQRAPGFAGSDVGVVGGGARTSPSVFRSSATSMRPNAAPAGGAFPPSLIAAGSVTSGWIAPKATIPKGPERWLNSQAAASTPLEAFGPARTADDDRSAAGSGGGAAGVRGRPPVSVRTTPPPGAARAPVGPNATVASLSAAVVAAGVAGGAGSPVRFTRSRPGSGNAPGGGGSVRDNGLGTATEGDDAGGGGLVRDPSWQRHSAMRSSRTSAVVGRLSSTGLMADDAASASAASSQFHSFTDMGEDGSSGVQQISSLPALHQQRRESRDNLGSAQQRSRLGTAVTPAPSASSAAQPGVSPLPDGADDEPDVLSLPPGPGPGAGADEEPGAGSVGAWKPTPVVTVATDTSGAGGSTNVSGRGHASPTSSPTQMAWAAAMSLSGRLFGRSSRGAHQQ